MPDNVPSENSRVLIAIVNCRTAGLVVECLRSLELQVEDLGGAQVVVVDNSSGDGSAERIQREIESSGWGGWATLLPSSINGGFSFGNNRAIRPALNSAAPPDYYWLLNPDTLVRPNALRELVEFMDRHPHAGICGSSLEGSDGEPWPYAFRFPTLLSELENGLRLGVVSRLLSRWRVLQRMPAESPTRVDWLPGCSMMVRREVFETVGLMDEGYFLYYEEADFCLQAQRGQWECWYVPRSRVMHIAGQSTGVTGKQTVPRRLPKYWFDSRRRYFVKNHGRGYAAMTDLVWLLSFSIWRVRRLIQRKPDQDPPRMWLDFLRNCALLNRSLPANSGLAAADRER